MSETYFTDNEKTVLLALAKLSINKGQSCLRAYVKDAEMDPYEVRKFGQIYYNQNLGEDEARYGQALADNVLTKKQLAALHRKNKSKSNSSKSNSSEYAPDYEDEFVNRNVFENENRGGRIFDSTARETKVSLGKKSKKNNKSKNNKSRRNKA